MFYMLNYLYVPVSGEVFHTVYSLHVSAQACLSVPCEYACINVSSVMCTLSSVRLCQCVLAQFQTLCRQQQDPQFQCQVTQCPLIPHNPPCLQAGDPCVSVCECVCMCLTSMTSEIFGYSHNALKIHFPISLSLLAVTSRLIQSQSRLSSIYVLCLSLGGDRLLNNKTSLL